ncbi:MAG: hypothetical protein N4J56_007497 [Chroococcidiopsis sp. SAG 2025]|uniref:hypothetical protein n=1 Tax=Chroococcidiopsis sp. SAG 2025 TaxID=171389 RepID=UPI0029370A7D|nr:hypothetical protein [Chroococcidiopsis sp. SAG 2025]MDV2997792.1 hypothetical protein [Chroococcidiopsis sp. SAG 2025]
MKAQSDPNPNIPHYDPHIIPAETVAREAREGKNFGHLEHDRPADLERIHTRDGYTIDREGLINNYAIEPEMYICEPGDLKAQELERKAERLHLLQELPEDEEGKLTMEHDWRHKGPGLI